MDSTSKERLVEQFKDDIADLERMSAELHGCFSEALLVEEAILGLRRLTTKHFAEVKAYANPPVDVMRALAAVMTAMQKTASWAQTKEELQDKAFLRKIISLNKECISDATLLRIQIFTNDPTFVPEVVGMVSVAAGALCQWIRSIQMYAVAYRELSPEMKACVCRLRSALQNFEMKAGIPYQLIQEAEIVPTMETSGGDEDWASLMMERKLQIWTSCISRQAQDKSLFMESPECAWLAEIVSLQETLPFVTVDAWVGTNETQISRFCSLVGVLGDYLLVLPCLNCNSLHGQAGSMFTENDAPDSVIVTSATGEIVFGPELLPEPITVGELAHRVAAHRACMAAQCLFLHGCRQVQIDELVCGGSGCVPLQLSLVVVPPLCLDVDVLRQAVGMRDKDLDSEVFLKNVDSYMTKIASTIEPHIKSSFSKGLVEGLWEIAVDISEFVKIWLLFERNRLAAP